MDSRYRVATRIILIYSLRILNLLRRIGVNGCGLRPCRTAWYMRSSCWLLMRPCVRAVIVNLPVIVKVIVISYCEIENHYQ